MLYQDKLYVHGLYFIDIFPDAETFESKVVEIDGLTNMDELYEVLFNKYLEVKQDTHQKLDLSTR